MTRRAIVTEHDRGAVWKAKGRWHWQRGRIAVETYARSATLIDVREHIARLFRVPVEQVQIRQ